MLYSIVKPLALSQNVQYFHCTGGCLFLLLHRGICLISSDGHYFLWFLSVVSLPELVPTSFHFNCMVCYLKPYSAIMEFIVYLLVYRQLKWFILLPVAQVFPMTGQCFLWGQDLQKRKHFLLSFEDVLWILLVICSLLHFCGMDCRNIHRSFQRQ